MIWEHSKVNKTDTCWLWTGAKNRKGYGMVRHQGKVRYVHRLAYHQESGVDPIDLLICHHCDIPNCLRPSHLFLGDAFSNQLDASLKGRTAGQKKTHCKNGHLYSDENVYRDPRGYRECRECRRTNLKRWRNG